MAEKIICNKQNLSQKFKFLSETQSESNFFGSYMVTGSRIGGATKLFYM